MSFHLLPCHPSCDYCLFVQEAAVPCKAGKWLPQLPFYCDSKQKTVAATFHLPNFFAVKRATSLGNWLSCDRLGDRVQSTRALKVTLQCEQLEVPMTASQMREVCQIVQEIPNYPLLKLGRTYLP